MMLDVIFYAMMILGLWGMAVVGLGAAYELFKMTIRWVSRQWHHETQKNADAGSANGLRRNGDYDA